MEVEITMLDIVLGAQFGDEGKGRIVDHLCSTGIYNTCARVNGSDNAGHTIHIGGDKFSFNQIPVGAAHGMTCVIARGCMVDLEKLEEEIPRVEAMIKANHRPILSLYIDSRCHVKTQAHRVRDATEEEDRDHPIGTTLSGNGPAYADKYARWNHRVCDLPLSVYPNIRRVATIMDVSLLSYDNCLVEGAHGIMLDIDHGTYPFVTSSACTAAAACHSLGISPKNINKIIGVIKPYITRVGAGAFPTEIVGSVTRDIIRERGHEYGTNTKRPRRIGWLDLPALAYAVRISGITELAMCKIDILGFLDDVAICTEYEGFECSFGVLPARDEDYSRVNPICDYIHMDELAIPKMIDLIEKMVGIPVTIITNKDFVSIRQAYYTHRPGSGII